LDHSVAAPLGEVCSLRFAPHLRNVSPPCGFDSSQSRKVTSLSPPFPFGQGGPVLRLFLPSPGRFQLQYSPSLRQCVQTSLPSRSAGTEVRHRRGSDRRFRSSCYGVSIFLEVPEVTFRLPVIPFVGSNPQGAGPIIPSESIPALANRRLSCVARHRSVGACSSPNSHTRSQSIWFVHRDAQSSSSVGLWPISFEFKHTPHLPPIFTGLDGPLPFPELGPLWAGACRWLWGLRHHSSGAATFPWGPGLDKPFGKIVIFHVKVCQLTLVSTGKKGPDSQLFQHFSCISLAKPSILLRGRNERRRPPAPRRRRACG
jgi:hypothetical protein